MFTGDLEIVASSHQCGQTTVWVIVDAEHLLPENS